MLAFIIQSPRHVLVQDSGHIFAAWVDRIKGRNVVQVVMIPFGDGFLQLVFEHPVIHRQAGFIQFPAFHAQFHPPVVAMQAGAVPRIIAQAVCGGEMRFDHQFVHRVKAIVCLPPCPLWFRLVWFRLSLDYS